MDIADLNPLVQRLSAREAVTGVAVCGSLARDDFNHGSDIDLVALASNGPVQSTQYFQVKGHPAEMVIVTATHIERALADGAVKVVSILANARILYDDDGRLQSFVDDCTRQRRHPPPRPSKDRVTELRFETAHALRRLEAAHGSTRLANTPADLRLAVTPVIEEAARIVIQEAGRWPGGKRTLLHTLRDVDAELANCAEAALHSEGGDGMLEAAIGFLKRMEDRTGGPLPDWDEVL